MKKQNDTPFVEKPVLLTEPNIKNAAKRFKAVIICHGMGSQVPYETIEGVVKPLREFDHIRQASMKVRIAEAEGTRHGRVELETADSEIHFYEVYWSPLTAGKIKTHEVIYFLLEAAWSGCRLSFQPFDRFLFNERVPFNNWLGSLGSIFRIVTVLLILTSLFICFLTSVAAFMGSFFTKATTSLENFAWLGLIPIYTLIFVALAISFINNCQSTFYGLILHLVLAIKWLYKRRARLIKYLFSNPINFYFERNPDVLIRLKDLLIDSDSKVATLNKNDIIRRSHYNNIIGAIITSLVLAISSLLIFIPGILIVWILFERTSGLHLLNFIVTDLLPIIDSSLGGGNQDFTVIGDCISFVDWLFQNKSIGILVYACSFLAFLKFMTVFRDYVGDVAIYLSAHEASKFWEVRENINKIARQTAKSVLQAKDATGKPFYDELVFAGHSLGSVICYDLVNWCLFQECLHTDFIVKSRIKLLLTFGSPLDKTAFLFRSQGSRELGIREALSSATQPLIMNNDNQHIDWVNIWSPEDIISGKLEFYDRPRPKGEKPRIINIIDFNSNVPFIGHIQFWKNHLLIQILEAYLFDSTKQSEK